MNSDRPRLRLMVEGQRAYANEDGRLRAEESILADEVLMLWDRVERLEKRVRELDTSPGF